MNILSLVVVGIPILTGILAVHLLWLDENNVIAWIFKISLGIGLGLGASSFLYFVYLLFFAGKAYFLYVDLLIFLIILIMVLLKNRQRLRVTSPRLGVNAAQTVMLITAGIVFFSSFIGIVNYARQRMLGYWDAWMIYNRTARFIYRDQEGWQDSFSENMDVVFHADYPLLLSLNIASRWDILGQETAYVPMLLGILYPLACMGLCFGALARLKSLGQAGLGLVLLAGTAFFISVGGTQTADLPLAFYILASIVFIFFYFHEKRPIFMGFAGLASGMAAWTKNEGILFILACIAILVLAKLQRRSLQNLHSYFIGLFLPLIILLFFKSQLAPPSEFLSERNSSVLDHLMDISRHQIIFSSFVDYFLHGGGWANLGIFLVLCIYYLLFHAGIESNPEAVMICFGILACQILGYYLFYLITPYDLEWHLRYSLGRLMLHIFPASVFLVLIASQPAEIIFTPAQNNLREVS